MAERKSFLLRVDREVLDAVQRWANDDLRSLNGQIEFVLRRALRDTGRAPSPGARPDADVAEDMSSSRPSADSSSADGSPGPKAPDHASPESP